MANEELRNAVLEKLAKEDRRNGESDRRQRNRHKDIVILSVLFLVGFGFMLCKYSELEEKLIEVANEQEKRKPLVYSDNS